MTDEKGCEMRTRDKQRIYRRFFAGENCLDIGWTLKDRGHKYDEIDRITDVEDIIREGHEKGWDSGKKEA